MERKSTNETFEHFLRQNAEEFRMHASPQVWEGISESITKRKRKFYFGLALLLITSSILGYTVLDYSFNELTATSSSLSTVPVSKNKAPILNKISATRNEISDVTLLPTKQTNKRTKKTIPETKQPALELLPISFASSLAIQRNQIAGLLSNSSNNFLGAVTLGNHSFDFNQLPDEKIQAAKEKNTTQKKPAARKGKFGVMFYFTPSVSYRKLSENKSYLRSPSLVGVPYNYAALYDVNNAVTHKPNIGIEIGATTKYSLTKNINLRGGLQFNINRYDIKAFKFIPEVATIALNNGSSGIQSVNAVSSYRNFNGGQTDWLQNYYFQVSTPIGAEVKLHGTDKMYIGAATTIQPTYVIGDRAYLITADYKNYAEVPWLIRRWNVNTNLETFVAYSTGKLKWQVGPQVRYQLLSSFVSKYPVKENLFDFGLKVGISVNQNQ